MHMLSLILFLNFDILINMNLFDSVMIYLDTILNRLLTYAKCSVLCVHSTIHEIIDMKYTCFRNCYYI